MAGVQNLTQMVLLRDYLLTSSSIQRAVKEKLVNESVVFLASRNSIVFVKKLLLVPHSLLLDNPTGACLLRVALRGMILLTRNSG